MITKKKSRKELQLLRDEALDAYLNREDFQFDVNADAFYQQYKDHYTQLGRNAMTDTVGRAAALTGGYGSSYAQNVGQQAYQSHLDQLGDVVPELYQLAYDRYQDKGDQLYKTYQSWAELEQQAAQQEQWEREYELAERKRQDDYNQFLLKLESKNSEAQTQIAAPQPDHWAMLAQYKKLGQRTESKETAVEPEYDNGNVSEGNIKTMQRILGLQETGKWTDEDRNGAGGLTADKAWETYQRGQLQNYKSVGLGDMGLSNGNVKMMERVLGLKEDGYWSKEDQKAAGGLSEAQAWEGYQRGLLRKSNLQVSNKVLTAGNIKSMERVLGLREDGVWSAEDQKATNGFSAATAWEAYQSGSLQRWKSRGLFDQGLSNGNVKVMERVLGLTEDGIWTDEDKKAARGLSQADAWKAYQSGQLQNWKSRGVGEVSIPSGNDKISKGVQDQLEDELSRLNREIAQMENDWRIYKDLTTRMIGKAEEPKLEQLNQQYSSLGELEDAIRDKKKYTEMLSKLQSRREQAEKENAWKEKYSGMTYSELKDVISDLEDGEEKDWVTAYAPGTMTRWDYTMAVQTAKGELGFVMALQDEDQRLKKRLRVIEPGSGEAKEIIARRAEIYSQYGDLDDYIKRLNEDIWWLERGEKYKFLDQNQDFAELSQVQDNGSWLYKIVNDPSIAGKFDFGASVGKYVGPLVGSVSMAYDALNFDNLQHMNDDERAIFNYVYAKEGEKAAREYLDYLEYSLNERSMNKTMEWVSDRTQDIPFLSQATTSLLSTPLALMGGHGWVDVALQNLRNKFTGNYNPIDYNRDATVFNRSSDGIRDTVGQNIEDAAGEFWADAYQLGMNVLDSKAVSALKKIHPALGMGLLGSSAATQAMLDAVEKGATDEQALTMGFLGSCFAMLFDALEVDELLNADSFLMKKVISPILEELVGRGATEIANSVTDYMIMAKNSNYEHNIQRYLTENPSWRYAQAERQALIDAALRAAEADVDELSGLVFASKAKK